MEEKITNYSFTILGLFRAGYGLALHSRAMGKRLGVSHVTLLPYLRQLERKGILGSRMVGKNKEYFLDPRNSLTKHYLVIVEELAAIEYLERNFVVKKIRDSLLSLNLTGSLVLFGSYVKDYSTEASDIDLFYLGKFERNQLSEMRSRGRTYGKEINAKSSSAESFLNGLRTDDALVKEIVADHIVLENPGLFVNIVWRRFVER